MAATTHNYYRILGIKTTAGVQEIRQAIEALHRKDTEGRYAATLKKIDETLSDPEKRGAYDDELGIDGALRGDYYVSFQIKGEQKPKQTFVDVSGKEYGSEEALRNAQKARYNQMTVELEEWEKSIASRNKFLSMGRSFVFLGMLAGALLVGFFAGKPFYDSYQAKKQAEAAYGELVKAGKSVMDYIRAEQAFPSTVPYYERDGNYYDINVKVNNENLQGNSIELSFNNEAYDGLQNGSLTFELYQIPNGILDWRCHAQIPGQFAPVRCMVN